MTIYTLTSGISLVKVELNIFDNRLNVCSVFMRNSTGHGWVLALDAVGGVNTGGAGFNADSSQTFVYEDNGDPAGSGSTTNAPDEYINHYESAPPDYITPPSYTSPVAARLESTRIRDRTYGATIDDLVGQDEQWVLASTTLDYNARAAAATPGSYASTDGGRVVVYGMSSANVYNNSWPMNIRKTLVNAVATPPFAVANTLPRRIPTSRTLSSCAETPIALTATPL